MTEGVHTITVPESAEGSRLDVFLLTEVPAGTTRSRVQRAIREEKVTVDEKQIVKPSSTVHAGQTVRMSADAFADVQPAVTADTSVPLDILHEDPQLIVVNKTAGIPVHAGVGRVHPTLADALLARYQGLAEVGEDPLRPGIVHRLDKDTSGVLLVARTAEMFTHLKRAFREQRVRKQYTALVRGVVSEDEGTIKLPIVRSTRNPLRRVVAQRGGGKAAETTFHVRERFAHYTLLDVFPRTGRMHQIRVHLAHLGFPVVGDPLYGKQRRDPNLPPLKRQLLHAVSITLTFPSGKQKTFTAPLPADLQEVLGAVRRTDRPHTASGNARFRVRAPRHVRT